MTTEDKKKANQADQLVDICTRDEFQVELFHDEVGDGYARVFRGPGWRILRLHSRSFKRWLARKFWDECGKTPNAESMASALAVLEGKAIYEGQQHELFNRVCRVGEAIYYDLTNEDGEAVVTTKAGWQVVNPPILFRSYKTQKAQAKPAAKGDVKRLLDFVNIKDEGHALLLLVYVVAALIPDIPRPMLHAYGDQGSAKTTVLRLLKSLLDPSKPQTLPLAGSEAELVQKLSHNFFPCFDNVSHLPTRISDCLCRAVTGEGHVKRELYTDDDDIIYTFKRAIGINGINVAARRPDLLDRCLLVELERIPPNKVREETELWHEFEQAKPEILAGIFETLSCALAIFAQVKPAKLFRMADFTRWGAVVARSLGYGQEEFLNAYGENLARQNAEALAGSNVATAVLSFLQDRETWRGSAAELLSELEIVADEQKINTKQKGWPKAPNTLSRRLNEIKSNLADAGIDIDREKDVAGFRGRVISFKKWPENSVASVASTETPAKPSDDTSDGKKDIASHVPSQETPNFTSTNNCSDGSDGISHPSGGESDDSYKDPNTGQEVPIPKESSADSS